jgi:hypothetical protein
LRSAAHRVYLAEGSLRWVGPYEFHELEREIAGIGWAVIPSIWWEYSPMVIQRPR